MARLLLIEDEALVATDLERRLARMDHTVVAVADTAEDAIVEARHHRPDLVLSDIRIKGPHDGTYAARKIQTELDLPVVFLTAHADDATIARARVSHPFGYINKPYTETDLRTGIEIALERHRLELRLKQAERLLNATLRSIGDAVIATDPEGRVRFMNRVAESLTGRKETDCLGLELSKVYPTRHPLTWRPLETPCRSVLQNHETALTREKMLVGEDNQHRLIEDSCSCIQDDHGEAAGCILVFRDITERKKQEGQREQLITDLQLALARVKTLSGLLPICAWCKSVRNDEGYWQQVEHYLSCHTNAQFTHSICPDCSIKNLATT